MFTEAIVPMQSEMIPGARLVVFHSCIDRRVNALAQESAKRKFHLQFEFRNGAEKKGKPDKKNCEKNVYKCK